MSAALPQQGNLTIDDLSGEHSDGTGVEWDDRYLAIATHFGYGGDNVPCTGQKVYAGYSQSEKELPREASRAIATGAGPQTRAHSALQRVY